MRKLFLATIPACLIALPAVAQAAPEGPAARAADELIAAPLASDPFERLEARREVRIAAKRAMRDAKPRPKPRPQPEPAGASPALEAIAACESGGDPTAIGGGGLYRGKYQFSVETWQAVGGSGDPASAPEAEQDRLASVLYAQSGAGQWPVCSQ